MTSSPTAFFYSPYLVFGAVIIGLLITASTLLSNIRNNEEPRVQDFVKAAGYPVEAHKITTEDGYILTFFRIQAKN